MSNEIRKTREPISLDSEVIKKINDDIFRIKISIQLRSIGVRDILLDREHLEIFSEHFGVRVSHHGKANNIIDEVYDQLLDPDYDLPAIAVKKIVNYFHSIFNDIDPFLGILNGPWKHDDSIYP